MSLKHVELQNSSVILAASITTEVTALITTEDFDILIISNSLDQPVIIKVPNEFGITTDFVICDSSSLVIDARVNAKRFVAGTFTVRPFDSSPTSGMISFTAIR